MATVLEGPFDFLADMAKMPDRLWYRGDLTLLKRRRVAIVGSRRPSGYTRRQTALLAAALARRGVVIVSGGAMGVDATAHKSAGAARTILVPGNGVDIRYPAVNAPLIEAIEREGLVMSRFAPGERARPWSFVVRNEMVVALGEALVVTEAEEESGSMRSVAYAQRMGRPIFVLPHRLDESGGTNGLLARGEATAIYDIDAFADRFGTLEKREDVWEDFVSQTPTLEEAVARFGERVYEAELEGSVAIRDGRIYPT